WRAAAPSVCYCFFSRRRRHTRWVSDWSSDVCSSDLAGDQQTTAAHVAQQGHVCCRRLLVAGRGGIEERVEIEAQRRQGRVQGAGGWERVGLGKGGCDGGGRVRR